MESHIPANLRPADYFVVNTHSDISAAIEAAEFIADGFRRSPWTHAGIVTDVTSTQITIVEAMPGGAQEVAWHYDGYHHAFSSGHFDLTSIERGGIVTCAKGLAAAHVGYAFADYGALALHTLRIPYPGLEDFVRDSGHMICSQAVDYCYQKGGYELFDDGRWNGYVMPSSLGFAIGA